MRQGGYDFWFYTDLRSLVFAVVFCSVSVVLSLLYAVVADAPTSDLRSLWLRGSVVLALTVI